LPHYFDLFDPTPSARAQFVERRTYLRPLDEDGAKFETPVEAMNRVMDHQRWLWENAVGRKLYLTEEAELSELRKLMELKLVSVSGRVKWMGGTDLVKERAAGAFNCSFTNVEIPADLVDTFWLLLQGCGVGFKPKTGLLTGLPSSIVNIETVGSTRTGRGGREHSSSFVDLEASTWTIQFGDSAKGWAKALGSLTGDKPRVKTLILDFSELRPAGKRLRGYGWLSSGWEPLMRGMLGIVKVMQARADDLLTAIDIGDIVNWLGTVLSSRRSAQIWLEEVHESDLFHVMFNHGDFIDAKTDRWEKGVGHREQSNNSLMFMSRPDRQVIVELLHRILETGEPGFVNGEAAKRRAPEMQGMNPCAEILLPSKGFCNLMQVVWHRFNGHYEDLKRAQWLAGRANYRQTCVAMRDGVLQLQWNDSQKLLRLCGVSPTGYVAWESLNDPKMLEGVRDAAIAGANSMADELALQRPRRVTQVQPAGTVSKALGLDGDEVHEGAHLAMSRWIFNNINFPALDPMVEKLRAAGYRVRENPVDPTGALVTFPVEYPASPMFTKLEKKVNGRYEDLELNLELAVSQLERYRLLMKHYVQHNCSITVSFNESEIEDMADWFMKNWDDYVGVSFLKRNDPTLSAKDLGFKYLPQQPVSKRMYDAYVAELRPVNLSEDKSHELLELDECATGACPIR
jgi:ribonucleoside-triphosphate reductase